MKERDCIGRHFPAPTDEEEIERMTMQEATLLVAKAKRNLVRCKAREHELDGVEYPESVSVLERLETAQWESENAEEAFKEALFVQDEVYSRVYEDYEY